MQSHGNSSTPVGLALRGSLLTKILFAIRDLRSGRMFDLIRRYCGGDILDVGGWDFFLSVQRKKVPFARWVSLDIDRSHLIRADDPRFLSLQGDGYRLPFADGRFDSVLSIQVLEHVFDPMAMVREIARVLKPGGCGIFLIPQTANIHMVPQVYYNFTRFWAEEAIQRAGLDIREQHPLGGAWSTIASRLVYFFPQSLRVGYVSDRKARRNAWFYALYPLMAVFALLAIPLCLLFSLGDLREEPNNILIVAQKSLNPTL